MKVSIELYPCCCMTYGLVERFTNLYFTYMGVEALLQEIAVQDEWLHFLVLLSTCIIRAIECATAHNMEEPDVQFEAMNNAPFDFSGLANPTDKSIPMENDITVPKDDKIYGSLKEELLEKCHPGNFMKPFVKERFDCANSIYRELLENTDEKDPRLIGLRNLAMEQLDIQISTKKIYDYLLQYCNPEIYLDPYNGECVEMASVYYDRIQKNANNIIELEKIENDAQPLIKIREEQIKAEQVEREKEEQIKVQEKIKALETDERETTILVIFAVVAVILIIIMVTLSNS